MRTFILTYVVPLAVAKLQAQFGILLLLRCRRRDPDDTFTTRGTLNLVPSLSSFKTSPQTHGAFYVGHSRPWAKPLESVMVMWAHIAQGGPFTPSRKSQSEKVCTWTSFLSELT